MADDNMIEIAVRMMTGALSTTASEAVDLTQQATSSMGAAFESLAVQAQASMNKVQTSTLQVGAGMQQVGPAAVQSFSPATEAITALTTSVNKLTESLTVTGAAGRRAGREIAQGMQEANFSMREAKGSMALIGEEIGVRIPRHIRGFVAELPGVGAAMSAAFEAFALIALIQILVEATQKLTEFIAETYIFTEAQKEAYAAEVELNKEIDKQRTLLKGLKDDYELIGVTGSKATNIKFSRVAKDVVDLEAQLRSAQDTVYLFEHGLNDIDAHTYEQAQRNISELRAKIDTEQQRMANLSKQYDTEAADEKKQTDAEALRTEQQNLATRLRGIQAHDAAVIGESSQVTKMLEKQYQQQSKSLDNQLEYQLQQELKTNELIYADLVKQAHAREQTAENDLEGVRNFYDEKMLLIEGDSRLGVLTQSQATAALRRTLDQQYQAEMTQVRRIVQLYRSDPSRSPEEVERLQRQVMQIEDKYRKQRLQIEMQDMQRKRALMDGYFSTISRGFSSSIIGMLNQSQTFGEGMKNLWNSVAAQAIEQMVNMATTWVEKQLFMLIFGRTTQMTAARMAIMASAAQGYAAAYASTAAIPIVGPELAPAVAGATFASIMASQGFFAFERGGNVPSDMLAYVHKNEMVLPASLADTVRSASRSGVSSEKQQSMTINMPLTLNAMDAKSFKGNLRQHQREITRMVKKAVRDGGIQLP